MTRDPDFINAGNSGPFTLDGTRSYLVGSRRIAVIDPGPDVDSHVRALSSAVSRADEVVIVLTHGHGDHAAAAPALAAATGAEVWGPEGVGPLDRILAHGATVETDRGDLIALHTPGHTQEHLCFHWSERRALFAGDMVLGEGDTTWVAEYPGCVADYLDSIARLRTLDLEVVYPTHGPALADATEALDRFEGHRRRRISQVRAAMQAHPGAGTEALLDVVYGDAVPEEMRGAALRSLQALMDFARDAED